ncbi:ABC transporter ATP-binding protein [Desulfosarcina ovata subsp. sediminis]|uniref:ABC transporter ATP-binding protein n=1 Tax=Desulfosarcina ovata subsp. sediminis TaxID=885957 RepID=A0A5K7ZYK2_9BACT|nr:ABC transporter ATP-binding protein [Desulfosarcina ovata]BBO85328.1 ABC transporter ATP-binding protein [Desulfosarcina ovata subsp. sediminis]
MTLLQVDGLRVKFMTQEGSVEPLDGVSFMIEPGQILGLVGETGSGKSVTAQAIMGLLPFLNGEISGGRIWFRGQDMLGLSEEQWQKIRGNQISLISQNPMTSLDPVYRVGHQIVEGMRLHLSISAAKARQRAIELMASLQIPDAERVFQQYPHQLSGGLKQRIVIAMGLCADPQLLIADEPTTALDVTVQAQIVNLFKATTRNLGVGLLLITHDLGVIAQICDSVAVMYAGTVVESGDVSSVFASPRHPYTRSLLGCIPTLGMSKGGLMAIPGNVPSVRTFPQGCRFHPRCSERRSCCATQKPRMIPLDHEILVGCLKYDPQRGNRW